jgi:hypothetical protein
MAVDRKKFDDLLSQLPEELQNEVLQFVEALVHKNDEFLPGNDGPPLRTLFGSWDSGDQRSGDNERIDADLAKEYESPHEADT